MAQRTIDLLPEIFRTDTNRKFFSATLDQLTQEPNLKRTQGYVGRRVGPGVNPADSYVVESSATRTDYQLEPGVVFLKPDTQQAIDAITYPGIIDALGVQGADVSRQDRLFSSEYYSWDPFCDLDKFTNYSQYYWLANGPASVDVFGTAVPLTDSWEVTRSETAYTFSDEFGNNPTLTLVRGGSYEFSLDQPGHKFWIQAAPGISGTMPYASNISSRDVLGVVNNGIDRGVVQFNVPLKTAQDFFYNMPSIGSVDLLTSTIRIIDINNVYVDEFFETFPNGIDGITDLDGRTIVFTNQFSDPEVGGWELTTQYDPLPRLDSENGRPGSFDSLEFDQTTIITNQATRYSVWQINYVYDESNRPFMRLSSVLQVPNLNKFNILFGEQWSSTQWYKNASGFFQEIPLLTAVLDTLWYQDSTNPEIFGRIKLVDQGNEEIIDIDDIIGSKTYISPNGVTFTNGLKVQFRGDISPASFKNREFYVEGVGTGPDVDDRIGFIDGEAYFGPWHEYQGQKMTGWVHSTTEYQQYIYDTVAESLENTGAGGPAGAPLPNRGVSGAAQGNGIKLIPVEYMITPEQYIANEISDDYSTDFDNNNDLPRVPDYITINRASRDLNPWSRSNRWFHIDVLRATAEYNNQDLVIDNTLRGRRPIIEFRPNIGLFNFGTQGKTPVNIVDFSSTDALSLINGQAGYGTDGYTFVEGTLVIFAKDRDLEVRSKVWRVTFIETDDSSFPKIYLVPASNTSALVNQTVVALNGIINKGKSFWFDGVEWIEGQQKNGVNQPPKFDVTDANGNSFGNKLIYPSSTFEGSQLFGYAPASSAVADVVLGFPLRYLNISNVGDIVFENFLYSDTFLYVTGNVSKEVAVSSGFVREYIDRVTFTDMIGWQTAITESRSRQIFQFTYNQEPIKLDIPVDQITEVTPLQIFIEGTFVETANYTFVIDGDQTVITFVNINIPTGAVIEVQALSDVASVSGYYQVPLNLENNPLNANSNTFTLGTIRTHYEGIGQNLKTIQGPVIGANNTRDLGNILRYGDVIVQQSSPLALTGVFLRQKQFEIFNAIEFNSREYTKYKTLLLDLTARGDFENLTPTQILDTVLQEISISKTEISPFYWSDMIPAGETYSENTYTYSFISTPTFDTIQTYNFTSANFLGLLVYLNGVLLTKDVDYEVAVDAPSLTITAPLAVGDTIKIREYPTTYGSFVPNTPTKLGLYPSFEPQIYVDNSYITPTTVIRGHDGSITVGFGDLRDQVLLEFEKRIFNNLKIATPVPLVATEVTPGQFRTTDYTLTEINDILSTDFLSWVGWNKIDYTSQEYLPNNPFTYNYSQSSNVITRQPSLGAWRGIYDYFFDTYYVNSRPWEMIGLSKKPDWWEAEYGPAPYTSGNTVLWDDIAAGLVKDPAGPYINPLYIRPDLMNVLPVGSEGELLDPLESTIGNYDATSFRRSWKFGDVGPVENVWRTSSSWPFAVMRLLALTKPAKFFSLFADRDRYVYNENLNQYLWDGRYRLDATKLSPLYGNGVSKASYLNWIIDYNRQLGINSTDNLTIGLNNIDVRLCWRTGAFTGKNYLRILTERSTPDSQNTSQVLPDESYQLLLYKNQPFDRVTYSSVIVQKTNDGYAVLGYSQQRPFFTILESINNGNYINVAAGGSTVKVNVDHTENIVQIPYGYVFTNEAGVCDFLVSYGALLKQQGFVFETRENGYTLNWLQMAQEFLYWVNQGWATGAIINLNPAAVRVSIERPQAIVDSINVYNPDNIILNQNRQPLPLGDLIIDRIDNLFRLTSQTTNTINYTNLQFTAYEHLVILDNRSIFADLLYEPVTGVRQSRVLVSGWLTGDWTGRVNAPGFILNQDNIVEWVPNRTYTKGQIVLFKNEYWSASTIIQPSQSFNYNEWIKSDYADIQKGLLPNAANSSDQLATAYSVYDANLETEVDLFSYGLIGFRPRQYMQALNLDDVSQVNLYQQFLKSKGTRQSAEVFSLADLGKETAEYNIYEYWQILRSQYGATASRSYIELLLNQALLESDPSLIQVIQPGQESEADQTVLLQNVWKSSSKLNSTNILPTTTALPTDIGLPSAGYVSLDDVDFTAFDLNALAQDDSQLNQIGEGTVIWVANVNDYDWGIYVVNQIRAAITTVSDNLNNQALVTFTQPHGLSKGNILIIRFFDNDVNGIYRVSSVPSLTTLLIDFEFTGFQTTYTGEGVGFTLSTARVAQPSDIAGLPYARELIAGARVWVDNNGAGLWTVLEKTDPFESAGQIQATVPESNSQFGAAVAQGNNNLTGLIGAPRYNPAGAPTAPGGVYAYIKNSDNEYQQSSILTLTTADAAGYGGSISIGNQFWSVIGASESADRAGYAVVVYKTPGSDVYTQLQVLTAEDFGDGLNAGDEFGYSVTMSQDENWIYVGAPGANKVYAYGRIDYQNQFVRYTTDDVTNVFNYSNSIVIDNPEQLIVSIGTQVQRYNIDYVVTPTDIRFPTAPSQGQQLTIARIAEIITFGDGSTVSYDMSTMYSVVDEYSVGVYVDGALQRPNIDYTFDSMSQSVVFTTAPADNSDLLFQSRSYFSPVFAIDRPGTTSASSSSSINIDYGIQNFVVATGLAFDGNNKVLVRYNSNNYMIGFIQSYNSVTGDLEIDVDNIQGSGTYSSWTISVIDRFGHNVDTTTDGRQVIVGCPNVGFTKNGVVYPTAGEIYVYDRSVQSFQAKPAQQNSFETVLPLVGPTQVYKNGALLVNDSGVVSGDYSIAGNTITLNAPADVGDIITIATNQFNLLQEIYSQTPAAGAGFGWVVNICTNNCSLYSSSPFMNSTVPEAGQVEVDTNQARIFGTITSTVANPVLTPGDYIRVNNFFVELTGTTVEQLAIDINAANIPNAEAVVTDDGRITFRTKNFAASVAFGRLQVLPGTGTLLQDLGLNIYEHIQVITAPIQEEFANFGKSLVIGDDAVTLFVGATNGSTYEPTTFDNNTTTFDASSTEFYNKEVQSGVVYQYDSLPAANATVDNPRQFVFGQQIYNPDVTSYDQFGTSINYTSGVLWVGAPGDDLGDSSLSALNYGSVLQLVNENQMPAWIPRRVQQPVVDVSMLNTIYIYDRVTNKPKKYFDYFNPLQGRLLGAVAQNLDYIGAVDPAAYNVGPVNNWGSTWTQERVGQIWWNTSRARFIDPNQDDPVYASRRWGQLFPGSEVEIYQWISSTVPPADYTGPGTVRDTESYVVSSTLNEQGVFGTIYFFWVTGISSVNRAAKKTLSIDTLRRYIESPKSSGISYFAPIGSGTFAIYNGLEDIVAEDTILHIEYDQVPNDAAVHLEYQLVPQDRADGFLSASLYQKLQDSFCGVDVVGNLVPDPFLSPSEKYGTASRPRQSLFFNRFLALKNYLQRANTVLKLYPISESRTFNLLNSEEPQPSRFSDAWDKRVANLEELSFQNLAEVGVGYKYLVESDSTYGGLWTIYQVVSGVVPGFNSLALIRVQNYRTTNYWSYIDWYLPGYNPSTRILLEVPNYSNLETITVPAGSSVKVSRNAQGKWEIYQYLNSTWIRVGLEDGTIEFSAQLWDYQLGRFGFDIEVFDAQFFDQEPVIETRKIIQAINEELFVGDLLIERNRLLILMFNYVESEQQAPSWLTKTSLIDVDHVIRDLVPFQVYRRDNQDFVLDYIQEVKPYHVQIREFNLIYRGYDEYLGTLTDFDLPAYWDVAENLFISPVLDNTGTLSTTSSVPSTSPVWQTFPWNQWYQNYLLNIEEVTVINGGSGYTEPPQVVVTGECIRPATMIANINSLGRVASITIVDPGEGYLTTAIITFTGGNGSDAQAVAVMGNQLVRNIGVTMKFDRYQYNPTFVDWQPGVNYDNGTLVRYDDRVWSASSDDSTAVQSETFDPSQWTLVPAGDLSGVDRTMGYYQPTPDMPGLDLSLLISGVDYPGVQVKALDFDYSPGFDVGYGFDMLPYDNLAYGPEGRPTYDPAVLDAIYESEFDDPYLGTAPAPAYEGDPPTGGPNPIIVAGGAFVDTYSSHAPEELVPGAIFDTLDIRVFSTLGSDWENNGHGFPLVSFKYTYEASIENYSFAGLLDNAVVIQLYNQSTGLQLIPDVDYLVDWADLTVEILPGAAITENQIFVVTVYALGGGNQLFSQSYDGADVGNSIIVDVEFNLINSLVIYANGENISSFSYAPFDGGYKTKITFGTTYTTQDYVVITAFGFTDVVPNYSYSVPVTQYIESDGSTTYTLTNSLSGTNPANIIVEKNGVRAKPAAGVEYISDGTTVEYAMSARAGYLPNQVSNSDVTVYVDTVLQVQGSTYVVDPWDGISSFRTITFGTSPAVDSKILISVNTGAQYTISGNTLTWQAGPLQPIAGDIISVTTWNDTRQQNILTQVFVGPTSQGTAIEEGFSPLDINPDVPNPPVPGAFDNSFIEELVVSTTDPGPVSAADLIEGRIYQIGFVGTTDFTLVGAASNTFGTIFTATGSTTGTGSTLNVEAVRSAATNAFNNLPESFDFSGTGVIKTNVFDTGRIITDSSRLIVTLDGQYLFDGNGFTVDGTNVIISGPIINGAQVVTITSLTDSTVPGPIAFRIFQDMRGLQTSYRILPSTSTYLTAALTAEADIIYVDNASNLAEPNLELGLFGMITINGERITYRERNTVNNTVSGLRRGTAGTGAADHPVNAAVYDIGIGSLLPIEYQNVVQTANALANGIETTFVADNIDLTGTDQAFNDEAVEVYVGGIRQMGGYTVTNVAPVTVEFAVPPTENYQVTIAVRRGLSWYDQQFNGVPLQEQDTVAARFIRGD